MTIVSAHVIKAPQGDHMNLAGTTSQATGTALPTGRRATAVFNVDVRLAFGSTTPTATTNSAYWPAKVPYHWTVDTTTQFIAAINDDGSSAFKGSVWPSSP
jgi:hypothetical protein